MANKKNSLSTGLSPRQRHLLFAVVKEYCELEQTVSSQDLKEKYGFEFSPATIRNELTKLRDLGFLYQPFVNSSSQPTEKALRLFITQMIAGLQITNRQQQDLKHQIHELQNKQGNLQKEISRLLALETNSVGFAVNMNEESIYGIKNLLSEPKTQSVIDILDFLENLDKHKSYLLDHSNSSTEDNKNTLATIFGGDNPVLPLGHGFALAATEVTINNQKTILGIITQPHLLGRKKTLQVMDAIGRILNETDEGGTK